MPRLRFESGGCRRHLLAAGDLTLPVAMEAAAATPIGRS